MSSMTLAHSNGHAPKSNNSAGFNSASEVAPNWLSRSTRQFFSEINWDNQSQEVQQLRQTWIQEDAEPLSLTLNVHQFFAAIPWEGAPVPHSETLTEPALIAPTTSTLTLDDFSDLF